MNEMVQSIFTRLTGQVSYPVRDHAPQDQELPYIQINNWNLANWDSDSERGFNGTIDIIAHSDYRGSKEVIEMSDAVYAALHQYDALDTATYGLVTLHREFFTIANEGETRMGLNRYRIIFGNLP